MQRESKRRKGSSDEFEEIQNDCLLRGWSIKNKSRREIFLFPNRLELPSESILVPIDEILSINYVINKDGQPGIVIKPTGKNELTLAFEWKFEAEVSFRLIWFVLYVFSNGIETYCESGKMFQNCQKMPLSNSQFDAVSKMKSKIRRRSP